MEPTQEGEREVILRRVGTTQQVIAVYHIPAALHPDVAPLEVLSTILGEPQTGRLYKALVDTKLAVSTSMDGMSGDLSTMNRACCTSGLRISPTWFK